MLLWAVALRYGAFTRKAQRAYQDGLAETNEVQPACLPVVPLIQGALSTGVLMSMDFWNSIDKILLISSRNLVGLHVHEAESCPVQREHA